MSLVSRNAPTLLSEVAADKHITVGITREGHCTLAMTIQRSVGGQTYDGREEIVFDSDADVEFLHRELGHYLARRTKMS